MAKRNCLGKRALTYGPYSSGGENMKFPKLVLPIVALLSVCGLAGCGTPDGGGNPVGDSTPGPVNSNGDTSSTPAEPLPEGWQDTIRIYYRNDTASYNNLCLWVWATGIEGSIYNFTNEGNPDEYGLYCDIDLKAAPFNRLELTGISFIVRNKTNWDGQSQDVIINFNDYSGTLETVDGRERITVYSWGLTNNNVMVSSNRMDALGDRIGSMYFEDWRTLRVKGTGDPTNRDESEVGLISSYKLYAFPSAYYQMTAAQQIGHKKDYLIKEGTPASNDFTISFDEDIALQTDYIIEAYMAQNPSQAKSMGASFTNLYPSQKFIDEYTYNGHDLGVTTSEKGRPTIKVWAPTAANVAVRLYTYGTPENLALEGMVTDDLRARSSDMTPIENGVWTYTLGGAESRTFDFYTLEVSTGGTTVETIDPYAKSSGINGVRGALLTDDEWDETDPEGFREAIANIDEVCPIDSPNDLSVYEVHIRDFTADETWKGKEPRGTYNAFIEEGVTYGDNGQSVKTGFDSLKELGITAVQLLPVFDQDNEERTLKLTIDGETFEQGPGYNWGYNPLNYNVVEGSYSTDPYSPTTKIIEFKKLIQKCAENGIRVIMDVVYNHMSSVGNNSFNKLMPGYYFLTDDNGSYVDLTGVHNTFDTSRPMAKNFVVDSVTFWAEEFGIKGFRFDLMGAITTDTMRAVKDALYDVDPNIVVYGEPWRGNNPEGIDYDKYAGDYQVFRDLTDNGKGVVGCFNDCGRNALKGDTSWGNPAPSYGFMTQNEDLSEETIYNAAVVYIGEERDITNNSNSLPTRPDQVINYVSCHDNYTLYDQLNYCYNGGKGASTDSNPGVMDALIATQSYVLLSQGMAFIHGGEEIFRQKLMYSDNYYWDTIADNDYATLPDKDSEGNEIRLIRNSYAYGDEVNSYKWDRKLTYIDEFERYAEACNLRKELVKQGALGVDYDVIQGSYQRDGQTFKYSRLWDDIILRKEDGTLRSILAAQTEWTQIPDGAYSNDIYVFLGGRMDNGVDSLEDIGIGNGQFEVLYDSLGIFGKTMNITNNKLGIHGYQMVMLKRVG